MPHQPYIDLAPGDWTLVATGVEYVRIQKIGFTYGKSVKICIVTNKPDASFIDIGEEIETSTHYWESPPGLSTSDSVYARPVNDNGHLLISTYTEASA